MGRLLSYIRPEKIDSEGQLRAAQARGRSYTPAENARAKAAGYPSADAMTTYLQQRKKSSGSVARRTGNMLSLQDMFSWHPANTVGMASDAIAQANER